MSSDHTSRKRVAVWLLLEVLDDLYVVSGITSVCRRVSTSVSGLDILLVLDLLDVVWLVIGWQVSFQSTIRGLRLFVADGFSDCFEDCSSTPDICCRRIFAVAVRSVSWMLACCEHTKGYTYIATTSGKKTTDNSSIDSSPLLNIVYDLPYRVLVKYKYLYLYLSTHLSVLDVRDVLKIQVLVLEPKYLVNISTFQVLFIY